MVTIEQLTVADEPATWAALGFSVDGDRCRLGDVTVRLAGRDAGRGLVSWTLRGLPGSGVAALDGLATARASGEEGPGDSAGDGEATHGGKDRTDAREPSPAAERAGAAHPNGIEAIDHVVVIAPQLDRTVAALEAAGLDLRRIREQPTPAGAPRQAFFRLGAEIVEVVQEPAEVSVRLGGPERPAFFWGLALRCPDLDATVAALGEERSGAVRDAVQPGRRIATLRRAAGLALPIALMGA